MLSSSHFFFTRHAYYVRNRFSLASSVSSRNVISQHKVNEVFLDDFFPFLLDQSPTCDISSQKKI